MGMTNRVIIPTREPEGVSVADHFGRSPYIAIIDLDKKGTIVQKTVHQNMSAHTGGKGHAHNNVLQFQPNVVIVRNMGPRGIKSLESNNIAVLEALSGSVDRVVAAYVKGKLETLTYDCEDAHHK